MEILILYYSKGGNTRKLAQFVAEGVESVPGARARLRTTAEVTKEDFLASSGIIAGSPVYFGGMASELKRIFDEFVGIKKNGRQGGGRVCHLRGSHGGEGDHASFDPPMHAHLWDDGGRRSARRHRPLRGGLCGGSRCRHSRKCQKAGTKGR